jgi:hypothetical protein
VGDETLRSGHEIATEPGGRRVAKEADGGAGILQRELRGPQPALRDDWYPWVLAFGLGEQADAWSTERAATTTSTTVDIQSERPSSDSSAPGRTRVDRVRRRTIRRAGGGASVVGCGTRHGRIGTLAGIERLGQFIRELVRRRRFRRWFLGRGRAAAGDRTTGDQEAQEIDDLQRKDDS